MPISHVAPLSHPAEALHSPRHSQGGAGIYRDGLLHVKFCRLSSPCRASKVKVCTETAMPVGLTGRNNMSRSEIAYAAFSLNNGLKYGFFSTLLQVRKEGGCSVPWILWMCSSSSLLAGFLPRFFTLFVHSVFILVVATTALCSVPGGLFIPCSLKDFVCHLRVDSKS